MGVCACGGDVGVGACGGDVGVGECGRDLGVGACGGGVGVGACEGIGEGGGRLGAESVTRWGSMAPYSSLSFSRYVMSSNSSSLPSVIG